MSTVAGSGHPTSSLSAADLMAVLAGNHFTYDIDQPQNLHNDRLIFSKGHASPLYYAVYESIGAISGADLLQYRQFDSALEGHPTPRFEHTFVATGSLGQGLGAGLGMALGLLKQESTATVFVLLGDGEMAEGSVWEALSFAAQHNVGNLVCLADINGKGQTGDTAFGHHTEVYQKRVEAFGWNVRVIDGHSISQIDHALTEAKQNTKGPTMILAKTTKGKGVSFLENKDGWHGKTLNAPELERALHELGQVKTSGTIVLRIKSVALSGYPAAIAIAKPKQTKLAYPPVSHHFHVTPHGVKGEVASMREAVGEALVALAKQESIMVLDSDVGNSTMTELVAQARPQQFLQCFIAEQTMLSVALGLSKVGYYPIASTFAAFLTRAYDQIRMASVSHGKFGLIGTHVGVSIGQDGPSQMGLEDIAMMRAVHGSMVLSPSDAVSAAALVEAMPYHPGIAYMRVLRPEIPILYDVDHSFTPGGSVVLQSSSKDQVTIVATGITVHEALKAYELLKKEGIFARVIDAYSIKPIDSSTLHQAAIETGNILTVEDHWYEGGLGDAVLNVFVGYKRIIPHITKLAIKDMPRSGKPEQLLDHYGISARHIVKAVKNLADNK